MFLAGREELLADLDARLAAGDGRSGPRVVALCGLGGAGKTSVALEYAHRHLAELGLAWQFPADDPGVVAAGFGELAAQLGARELLDTRDPVASVHGALAASRTEWLLVFDNAPDRGSVASFLPPAGPGRVLITSRDQIWPGQAQQVPVLDLEVAADFLVNRTGDADRQAALELAHELDGLPLALEQAAAYVQATVESLAGYLSLFRRRRADMLGRGEPIGYPGTVASTWRLAFEDLQDSAPGAAGLLRLLAFCAPEAIPLRLLLQPRPGLAAHLGEEVAPVLGPLLEDELAASDAIAALRRYSLISPAVDGLVSVHRLVQAVTADQMPAELTGEWRQAAAALIEAAIPGDTTPPGTWLVCAALMPHAQAVLDLTSDGMSRIAQYLGARGNYPAARDLFQLIADAHMEDDAYGAEHPDTLTVRGNLARFTGRAGDPAAARDQIAALLPELEQVLGPQHPETLAARQNLARWTGQAGDLAAARDQYTLLLPEFEQVLGPRHPVTLTVRGDLALWTGDAGDPAAARDQYAALLPEFEQVFGPRHPATLTARNNLALWTGETGDPAAARDQYAALLPELEQVLGLGHPDTLAVRSNLAYWTGNAGDPAAARDQFAALLPELGEVFGSRHPDILTARQNLARWTGQAGDPAAARDQFAALLPELGEVFGSRHPDILTARQNLADWTGQAGNPAAARDQYAALLPELEQVLGPRHPQTLGARNNLAHWTGDAGDPAAARDQIAALLPELEQVLGPRHPQTLTARNSLAHWTGPSLA